MKFDNAFLTEAGNVGLQFKDKGEIFTVYKDKKGSLVCSEHASEFQKGLLITKYGHMAPRFQKEKL